MDPLSHATEQRFVALERRLTGVEDEIHEKCRRL